MSQKPKLLLDIECYRNYFLVMFMKFDGSVKAFEQYNNKELDTYGIKQILEKYEVITFNGNKYDIPLLRLALTEVSNETLKDASDYLINNKSLWDFEKSFKQDQVKINHIDIIEILPGQSSLKLYAARIHCLELEDLPIDPSANVTNDEMKKLKTYCKKDLHNTKSLFLAIEPQINLRRLMSNQYHIDLRSKSDAQMAEAVIKSRIIQKTGQQLIKPQVIHKSFTYKKPEFINFKTTQFDNILELLASQPFIATSKGQIEMPKDLLTSQIKINNSTYSLGMGGLHSTEKSVYYVANKNTLLCDWDVASYYPSIILNCELYPEQLGKSFLEVYKEIVTERLAAKGNGEKVKADCLKIVINGSFGKLGSCYSLLYAPELMVQVTVTGQLSLLMLIERLELNEITVISANTDGIVCNCPIDKEERMLAIIEDWELQTAFVMERSDYTGLYSRDVNNYIAVKYNGDVKVKGCFKAGELNKNPQNEICNIAVIEYLINGTDWEETIKQCKDITKFLSVRNVKGGAVKDKKYIGKSIRWYYAKNIKGTINYKTNGNVVPRTQGAKPLMDLPNEFPNDINYDWYINETKDLLTNIGMNVSGQMTLW